MSRKPRTRRSRSPRSAAPTRRETREKGLAAPDSFPVWIRSREALALAAIVVGGAALRFAALGAHSIWFDEALSYRDSGDLGSALGQQFHPPLYYVLLHGWGEIFGRSAAALRGLSALCGTLAIPLVHAVTRRLVGPGALPLLAAALFAFLPQPLWFAREMRMYALWTLLALVAVWSLLSLRDVLGWRWVAGYWLGVCGGALAHHYMVFYAAALAVAAFFHIGEHPWRKRAADWGRLGVLHLPLFVAGAGLVAVLALRGDSGLTGLLERLWRDALFPHQDPLQYTIGHLFFFRNWAYRLEDPRITLGGALLGTTLAVALLLFARDREIAPRDRIAFLVVTLLPLACISGLPIRGYPRLFSPTVPLLAIALAYLVWLPSRHPRPRVLTPALLALAALLLFPHVRDVYAQEAEPWDEVCAHVAKHETGNDVVFVTASYMKLPFEICYRGDSPVWSFPSEETGLRPEDVADRAAGHRQAWLIVSHAWRETNSDLRGVALSDLSRRYRHVETLTPNHVIQLFRFEVHPTQQGGRS